jgi:hypothetical protein
MYLVALKSMAVLLKSGGNVANTFTELSQTVECFEYVLHILFPAHAAAQAERPVQGSSYPPLSYSPPTLLSLLRTQEIHPYFALPT